MRHKGGHWKVYEECIVCKAVWQKQALLGLSDIEQQKVKPVVLPIFKLRESHSVENLNSIATFQKHLGTHHYISACVAFIGITL